MATITKYTEQQGLSPDRAGMPNVRLDNSVGRAVEGLGGAISSAAAQFQRRAEEREDLKAQDGYRKLQLSLGEDMEVRSQSMPEDGSGFHDDFVKNVYQPKRDEFLNSLPKRLRSRFETMLSDQGSDTEQWSIRAATKERDQLYNWASATLKSGQEQMAAAITAFPDQYEEYLQQGRADIEASPLPTAEKQKQFQAWENFAQVAFLNHKLETDPAGVAAVLGAGATNMLSPESIVQMVGTELERQETGGSADPDNAVSPKGALGRRQIMPDTAREIAKEIGDTSFPTDGTPEQIGVYLSNPVLNRRYSDHYIRKMARMFGREGGVEAVLIAYNGGPKRAKAWLKAGKDDSVLPTETKKYYREIMARMGRGVEGRDVSRTVTADKVKFEFRNADRPGEDKLDPDLSARVREAFSSLGMEKVKINSGFRDPLLNKRAGGAKGSQHIHGKAVDIDVSGMSHAQRVRVIEALSAAGITGLGIGSNIIHADTGGRRSWGYANSAGGGEVPAWARDVINRHMAGEITTSPGSAKGGRFATLPYNERMKFLGQADKALSSRQADAYKASAAQKAEVRTLINNDLAQIRATGTPTALDETLVSTVLGEADYERYVNDRNYAHRAYVATSGIPTMDPSEYEGLLQDYSPVVGSSTFAEDEKLYADIEKAIRRTETERTRRPADAAMKFPEVAEAYAKVAGPERPDPGDVQAFVALMIERQKTFGLKAGSEAPVPRSWAMQIGRQLASLPERAENNLEAVNAAIVEQYTALYQIFGDFTDEVIVHALQTYKGVGPNTAELLSAYMGAVAQGEDIRVLSGLDDAAERDAIESVSEPGFFTRMKEFIIGSEIDDPGPEDIDGGAPSADAVQRAKDALTWTPEDEEAVASRYGRAALEAAKRELNQQ